MIFIFGHHYLISKLICWLPLCRQALIEFALPCGLIKPASMVATTIANSTVCLPLTLEWCIALHSRVYFGLARTHTLQIHLPFTRADKYSGSPPVEGNWFKRNAREREIGELTTRRIPIFLESSDAGNVNGESWNVWTGKIGLLFGPTQTQKCHRMHPLHSIFPDIPNLYCIYISICRLPINFEAEDSTAASFAKAQVDARFYEGFLSYRSPARPKPNCKHIGKSLLRKFTARMGAKTSEQIFEGGERDRSGRCVSASFERKILQAWGLPWFKFPGIPARTCFEVVTLTPIAQQIWKTPPHVRQDSSKNESPTRFHLRQSIKEGESCNDSQCNSKFS